MGMTWEMVLNPTYNEVTPGSVLPTAGASVAASSTGQMRSNQQASPSASNAAGMGGNPFMGLVIFALLLAVIMFLVHRFGDGENDFSNVRASAYNIAIISLIAVAGIPLWRLAFGRLAASNVPGADHLATYVNAAG